MTHSEAYNDWHYEQTRRAENAASAKALEAATKTLAIDPEDFRTKENSDDITRDQKYVARTEQYFAENDGEGNYHAKALESFIQYSLCRNGWLNNYEDDSYNTEAIVPARYDDISNRVDLAATVHFNTGENVTFGLDLTTDPTPETIREKILIGSNDPYFKAPVGFSQLKYYANKAGEKTSTGPIPKYCIGIDEESVDDILDGVTVYPDNGFVVKKDNYVEQFKILHEMSKQNELFESALYAKLDNGEITPEEQELLNNIEKLDTIYLQERERIAKEMPAWLMRDVDPKDLDGIAQSIIDRTNDETFETILAITEQLYTTCEDDPKKLDKLAERARENKRAKIDRSLGAAAIKNGLER